MKNIVLECKNVSKRMYKKDILKNISFKLYECDILGLIGPNGAGKTTLIKTILGLQGCSGEVVINGYNIKTDFANAIRGIGATVENPEFYNYLTGLQNLKLKANMYNVKEEEIINKVKLVGLENRINDRVSKYSLGMKQRLAICLSLIHNPNILILDEPTNGLDVEGIIEFRNVLSALSNEGIAIIISSHMLSEIENICNKVCIIKNGEIVEITDLKKVKSNSYILKVDNTDNINLKYKNKIIDKNNIEIWCDEKDMYCIVSDLIKINKKIISFKENKKGLEEEFVLKVGGNKIV